MTVEFHLFDNNKETYKIENIVYSSQQQCQCINCGSLQESFYGCHAGTGAGAVCYSEPVSGSHVELRGSGNNHSGNVFAANMDGYLGAVCSQGWDDTDAMVVCRSHCRLPRLLL